MPEFIAKDWRLWFLFSMFILPFLSTRLRGLLLRLLRSLLWWASGCQALEKRIGSLPIGRREFMVPRTDAQVKLHRRVTFLLRFDLSKKGSRGVPLSDYPCLRTILYHGLADARTLESWKPELPVDEAIKDTNTLMQDGRMNPRKKLPKIYRDIAGMDREDWD